jgi:hypothetical protein
MDSSDDSDVVEHPPVIPIPELERILSMPPVPQISWHVVATVVVVGWLLLHVTTLHQGHAVLQW